MRIEELRMYRIGGYAIFDLVASFLGILILSPLLSRLFRLVELEVPLKSLLLLTLPLGILVHILVGNRTLMTRNFLDPGGHSLLKILIVGMIVAGVLFVRKLGK